MKTENSTLLCEISPVFKPYIQSLYNDLELGEYRLTKIKINPMDSQNIFALCSSQKSAQ